MQNRIKIAKAYKKLGFNIIPLVAKKKRPACGMKWKSIQGLDERFLSDREIDFWWGDREITDHDLRMWKLKRDYFSDNNIYNDQLPIANPKNNIGVLLGKTSGIFVLDIDSKKAFDWIIKNGEPDTANVRSSMPFKRHYYFQYPEWRVHSFNGRDVFNQDFEIKSDGVITVLPPSDHEKGFTYTWEKNPTKYPINPPTPFVKYLVEADRHQKQKRQREKRKQYKKTDTSKLSPEMLAIAERVKMSQVLQFLGARRIDHKWSMCPFHKSKSERSKPLIYSDYTAHCFSCQDQDNIAWNVWSILYKAGNTPKQAYSILADLAGIRRKDGK